MCRRSSELAAGVALQTCPYLCDRVPSSGSSRAGTSAPRCHRLVSPRRGTATGARVIVALDPTASPKGITMP